MMARDTEARFRERLRELEQDPDNALERVLIDVTEQIAVAMEKKGINRKQLAEAMGVKPPMVTRLLNGADNTTLRTLMRVAYALDTVLKLAIGRPERVVARRREAEAAVGTHHELVKFAPPRPRRRVSHDLSALPVGSSEVRYIGER